MTLVPRRPKEVKIAACWMLALSLLTLFSTVATVFAQKGTLYLCQNAPCPSVQDVWLAGMLVTGIFLLTSYLLWTRKRTGKWLTFGIAVLSIVEVLLTFDIIYLIIEILIVAPPALLIMSPKGREWFKDE